MAAERPAKERLSIVHLCAPAHVGGLERVVQGLARGQAERGHEVTVVAVVEPGADTTALFRPITGAGVRPVVLELPGRAYLRELREVRRLLAQLRPDVLHTHGYRPDLLHGAAARRRGIATVSTLHGSSRMGGLSHLFEWLQERALRRFDGVVAVSPPLVQTLLDKGVPRDRIHAIPNGWTAPESPLDRGGARRRLGVPDGPTPVIGWVGRLIPIKGADVFIQALARLPGDWVASVIGDGPERAAVETLAGELGLRGRVAFHGALDDAARLMAAFDLFVLSSRSEGTPMVLLEAMGAAVPIVATAVGGVPNVLDPENREGWLVPSESPERLAAAMVEALADPARTRERGLRGEERMKRDFDTGAWIRRHEEAYLEAMRVREASRSARP